MLAKRRAFWATNRVVNPVLRPMLRGRLGRQLGGHLAVVRYRGRRTGNAYELVAQYARDGSTVWILPGSPELKTWWRNFRDAADIELWLAGQHLHGQARAIEGAREPAAVREGLAFYLRQIPRARKSLGLNASSGVADPAIEALSARAVVVRVDVELPGSGQTQ